ncbi:hypothetical protein BaRGS_00040116 [Batillaria attramentaria]|uniref:Uncharacterized protein n=1 Tax=Batillaria attramentaria TaxID=370345 RepID=A0ABD0J1D4_9CAEN
MFMAGVTVNALSFCLGQHRHFSQVNHKTVKILTGIPLITGNFTDKLTSYPVWRKSVSQFLLPTTRNIILVSVSVQTSSAYREPTTGDRDWISSTTD